MEWVPIVLWGGFTLVAVFPVLFWLKTRLSYEITATHLQVRLLGVVVRRVKLTDIKRIGTSLNGPAENWGNVFKPKHRQLVIRRNSGWFRRFLITPDRRYVFRSELEDAMGRLDSSRNPGSKG